jgi:8-oxo-dGTP pyrophosphatase MutT (NUDIX family)
MVVAETYSLPGAAVALIVAASPGKLLLIRRAIHPHDPWSGHVALPGGRLDRDDKTSVDTAIRETREEVGVVLAPSSLLCSLAPAQAFAGATRPRFSVAPHLFRLAELPELHPAPNEVAEAFWLPLSALRDPACRTTHTPARTTEEPIARRQFPAIEYEGRIIWGLTHSILTQFLENFPDL